MTRAVLLAAVLGAAAVSAPMLLRPAIAEGSRPVRSLLEMRRENVVIQKWGLSCGAAALDILLRYEHGDCREPPGLYRDLAHASIITVKLDNKLDPAVQCSAPFVGGTVTTILKRSQL